MRPVLILSIIIVLTLQANAQNKYKCTFTKGTGFFKNSNSSIELKDSADKTLLVFKKDGLEFNNDLFVLQKQKKTILLIEKDNSVSIGSFKRNFRSFSSVGKAYKLSTRNRNGYNFLIIDDFRNTVAFVKISILKDECSIELSNAKDIGLLPFVFLTSINELNNGKAGMYLFYYMIMTDIYL